MMQTSARWMRRARRGEAGFSASEMLVVLAIIGIMVLVSMPALLTFYKTMRVRTAAHRLVSHVRLCRQVAVARRHTVTMVIQGKDLTPTYRAWEDVDEDGARDGDGDDDVSGNDDDEVWVVREDMQLRADQVSLKDVYHDATPATYTEEFDADEDSVMAADNKVTLRFKSNGKVVRVAAGAEQADTMLRVRMDLRLDSDHLDRWYVSFNQPGKVDAKRVRNPDWE